MWRGQGEDIEGGTGGCVGEKEGVQGETERGGEFTSSFVVFRSA